MTQPNRRIDPEVEAQLGLGETSGSRTRRTWIRRGVWVLVALALLGGLAWWRARGRAERAPKYVTAPVERGDLAVTVTATGTLSALDTVEVSSEVSGRVAEVLVDFNDRVRAGQTLAVLNPEQARARAQEAAAQVNAAAASLVRARATADESRRKLQRAQELSKAGLLSKDDLDTAQATARRADADVGSASAQVTVARASLADVSSALRKATIASPIDGIVLSRTVEPGQTVAASLQAPVLFTLARDLTQMKLEVKVDEADVGKVHEGDTANFTVDAYPGRTFVSRVESLRNVAVTDQNVVTYTAVLSVSNQDLALRPGMTATANIITEEKHGALLVPNAALRFTPPDVLAQENGARGGLFIPGVTRGNPFGRRGQQQQGGQTQGQGARGAGGPSGGGAAAAGAPSGASRGGFQGGAGAAGSSGFSRRGGENGGAAGAGPGGSPAAGQSSWRQRRAGG
ncbi:MAG TPA: efflux RND transporter periplasmic adaptor subunit, partial [Thermoanaerobaculia bacterium]|nr:efflux RND transporter periplasmic adaptor subunit [Thermoanaerobaculia bacterium]